jgi:hypothetical protein
MTAIADLLKAIDDLGKAMSLPDGPDLIVQRHDPSWECWKKLVDAAIKVRKEHDS